LDHTTRKLIGFASQLTLPALGSKTIEAAKARILSTLGVSLAAFDLEPVRIVRSLAQPVASGAAARIFGSLTATTPDMAAFVNSAMVRCLAERTRHTLCRMTYCAARSAAAIIVAAFQFGFSVAFAGP
jgi:2-methylcitrate dehydratase PrpD